MRYLLVIILLSCVGFAFIQDDTGLKSQSTISMGEKLEYSMYLGFFTVGKGITTVDTELYLRNDRQCFKVDAHMKTSSMVSWISKVNDNWGAYVDTQELVSHESYRNLREGKYRLNELIKYDQKKNKAYVQVADKKTGKFGEPKEYVISKNTRDVVASFMYLRTMDLAKYKVKDTIAVSSFFEDTAYKFKIIYHGKETVSTDLGKILCHKLVPIMPTNSLFRGENSVTVWISADNNQIPIKIDAKMLIGHAGTELVSFSGLHNPLKIVR